MKKVVAFLFGTFVGWWLPQGWYGRVPQSVRQAWEDSKDMSERERRFMSDATGAKQTTGGERNPR